MPERLTREFVGMRATQELFDGAVVNLGIGIPTLVVNFIPEGMSVVFHTENGALGFGGVIGKDGLSERADVDFVNAGGQYLTSLPGMNFFDSAESFEMIRGGHIDITILGVIEVSERGDLANWMIPLRGVGNIGGGMDLAFCAKRVIAVTEHTTKDGKPKIVKKCRAPLTAPRCVDLIITDIAVMQFFPRFGLLLKEVAPGWTAKEVQELTEPKLIISSNGKVKEMEF